MSHHCNAPPLNRHDAECLAGLWANEIDRPEDLFGFAYDDEFEVVVAAFREFLTGINFIGDLSIALDRQQMPVLGYWRSDDYLIGCLVIDATRNEFEDVASICDKTVREYFLSLN